MNPVEQVVEARRPVADIVERLKNLCEISRTCHGEECSPNCADCIAANEITTLRTQLAEAREALEPFARFACDPPCEGPCHNCIARATLERIKEPDAILGGEPHD